MFNVYVNTLSIHSACCFCLTEATCILLYGIFSIFSLGSHHDGYLSSSGCHDSNYVMTGVQGDATSFINRYMFSCCSQRSVYGFIARYDLIWSLLHAHRGLLSVIKVYRESFTAVGECWWYKAHETSQVPSRKSSAVFLLSCTCTFCTQTWL